MRTAFGLVLRGVGSGNERSAASMAAQGVFVFVRASALLSLSCGGCSGCACLVWSVVFVVIVDVCCGCVWRKKLFLDRAVGVAFLCCWGRCGRVVASGWGGACGMVCVVLVIIRAEVSG